MNNPEASPTDLKPAASSPVEPSSNETWLYRPKSKGSTISDVSVSVWLREIFDSPRSPFFSSRRSLLLRIKAVIVGQPLPPAPPVSLAPKHHFLPSTARFPSPIPSLPPQQAERSSTKQALDHDIALATSSPSLLNLRSSAPGSGQHTSSIEDLFVTRGSSNSNIQAIARLQEDALKAEVAAMAAASAVKQQHGSQQSLSSLGLACDVRPTTNSAPESPRGSLTQLTKTVHSIGDLTYCRSSQRRSSDWMLADKDPVDKDSVLRRSFDSPSAATPIRRSSQNSSSYSTLPFRKNLPDSALPPYPPSMTINRRLKGPAQIHQEQQYTALPSNPVAPLIPYRRADIDSRGSRFGFRPMRTSHQPVSLTTNQSNA